MDVTTLAVEIAKVGVNGTRWALRGAASKHCRHCHGVDDVCACTHGCKPRKNRTECSAVWKHCHHCRGHAGLVCGCPLWPRCQSDQRAGCLHNYICSGCGVSEIEGPIFHCRHCEDYGYCQECYNVGDHAMHSFSRYDWPGAVPRLLAAVNPSYKPPHNCNCDGCGVRGIHGIRFKCLVCPDFDLCSKCYDAGKHSDHSFNRFDSPTAVPIAVAASLNPAYKPRHICSCDGCGMQGIQGIRFKCRVCPDFDLCSRCYDAGKHSSHSFNRFDSPTAVPVAVAAVRPSHN
jgi:Zinc finger, ZZ type